MSAVASTRCAALGAILAAPLVSAPAVTLTANVCGDPHAARDAEARALYRHHRDTDWGWNEPSFSPACRAASEAHGAVMDYAREACAMPPPTTLAGLGTLALQIALANEGFVRAGDAESEERHLMALVAAALGLAGVTLPADFNGMEYRPEDLPCA